MMYLKRSFEVLSKYLKLLNDILIKYVKYIIIILLLPNESISKKIHTLIAKTKKPKANKLKSRKDPHNRRTTCKIQTSFFVQFQVTDNNRDRFLCE
jgi:hypothetical protein